MLKNVKLIKQQFKENPDIVSVSECDRSPVDGGGGYNMRTATMPENQQMAVFANPIDEDYIATTGMQIIAGENLTDQDIKNAMLDTLRSFQFILNQSAVKQLGWKTPQEAIGKKMFLGENRPGYVKAVVKDFHFQSLHEPIKSMVMFPEDWGVKLLVKLRGNNFPATISFLEKKWKELVPTRPFEYRFMDEDYNKLYNAELRLGKMMNLFSSIAIILACLGLFGLSSYTAQQRFKEIGIRKVLGASVGSIVIALSKDFVKLSLIAILIAVPIAWFAMTKWLQDFTYRMDMTWSIYFFAGAITILLAVATVSFHAIRAALMNPVKSLRTE